MPNRIKLVLLTIVVSLEAVSCVQDVILDARDEPQVVVECILSDEPVQTLYLVYTKGASRETAPALTDAVAALIDLTEGKEAGRFQRAADGIWQLEYAAVPAHNYRLEVSVPGHEPIWAEQAMPETTGVEVGWHSWDPVTGDNSVGYTFQLLNTRNPVWFWGVNYPSWDSSGEQTEYLITNSGAVDVFNKTKEAFTKGAWGDKHSGFQITSYPELQNASLYRRYLRFPASDNVSDTTFYISGTFQGYISDHKDFLHADVRPAELHYFSASEDYDRFLKDSYHLLDVKASTNMADVFLRDNVYSNIHGAIGLLGAKLEKVLDWEGRDTWQKSGFFLLGGLVASYKRQDGYSVSSGGLREAMLNCRPFELLHYEYVRLRSEPEYGEYPDLLPDWSPQLLPGFNPRENAFTWFYLDVIQDQEQLDSCGLGNYGEIDFSRKKVLVCVVSDVNRIPVLIGYGYPEIVGGDPYTDWPRSQFGPFIVTATTPSIPSVENYHTLFRCALLIDKDDQIADKIWSFASFTYRYGLAVDQSTAESLAWNYP